MIEVEKLTKYYGPVTAIKDVSFSVQRGEIVGFLGPNGAGKTTTMRILSCFMPASSGMAKIAGLDVFENSLEVRKKIGYVPESVPLYTDMTVWTYLNFVAEIKGLGAKERKSKVDKVMQDCIITDVRGKYIGKLSKGYRQRVGLAQALINDPEILILDEPTIGLDPKQIIEIRQLIKSLAGERTVILSTHILPEVSMVCQRVIIINEGRIVAVDTPENLTAQLSKSAMIQMQIDGPVGDVIKELTGVTGVLKVDLKGAPINNKATYIIETQREMDLRSDLTRAIVNRNWSLLELRMVDMTLEDIFIKLVTEEKEV